MVRDVDSPERVEYVFVQPKLFDSPNCDPLKTIPPMQGWEINEINWKLPILVLLNYKFNGVQSGIANAA